MSKIKPYSHIVIIYNPNSTGDAPSIAKESALLLAEIYKKEKVLLMPTERAGHAVNIAQNASEQYPNPLIVSVSGDGGYNEVINGVRAAIDGGSAKNPVVTVIGAGNANDHYRVIHKRKPINETIQNEPRPIDLLKVAITGRKTKYYYAHSYVGIGLTPRVAEQLNRYKLNPFKELKIIIWALFSIRPTKIEAEGSKVRIDSLVFANISQMAKVLKLTDNNSLHDGQFEMVEIRHTSIIGLLITLLRASTVGLKAQPRSKEYSFTLLEKHPLQIDGEIIPCKKGDTITVSAAKDAISSLI